MAHPPADDCSTCPLHPRPGGDSFSRRELLAAAARALPALALLGLAPGALGAMTSVGTTSALAARPGDRREEKRYPIPAADGVSIDKDASIILARVGAKVYAFSLACPHQNTMLRWNADEHEFQCPKHKSHYRPDGTFIEGRATRPMDRMAVRRDAAAIVVDLETLYQQDEHPQEWAAAFVPV